jgi:hypothetical protein
MSQRALLHISMQSALLLSAIVVCGKNKESTANTIIYSQLTSRCPFWRCFGAFCPSGAPSAPRPCSHLKHAQNWVREQISTSTIGLLQKLHLIFHDSIIEIWYSFNCLIYKQ